MLSAVKRATKSRRNLAHLRFLCYRLPQRQLTIRKDLCRQQKRFNSDCSSLTLENTFKCYELEKGPPMDVEISRDDAIKMYKQMVEIRRIEVVCNRMYKQKKIRGFCHLYNGQEAIAVGMLAVMRRKDTAITAYRAHAWTYLMGVTAQALMGELVGVKSGCSRGKGGSMHTYGDNFFGGNGIVGAQVPIGAGIAFAHRYRGDGGVCVALYGDGASNQGQVFEAYNMAKLWCLPCIFVCENNNYGMGTHVERHAAMTDFYMRGHYVPGLWVDGNQVLAVRSATQFAIDYALKNGPIVLEMNTYRFEGHSMSDPGTGYRTREEVKKMRENRDPITSFRKQMIALCLANEEELKKIDADIRKEIENVAKLVLSDKEVPIEELTADIYVKSAEPKIRGVSGYNLNHLRLSDVCVGKTRRTPPEEIKNVPVGEASLLSKKKAADKKKSQAKKDEKDKKGGAGKSSNNKKADPPKDAKTPKTK